LKVEEILTKRDRQVRKGGEALCSKKKTLLAEKSAMGEGGPEERGTYQIGNKNCI